jgi:hypothetical protein
LNNSIPFRASSDTSPSQSAASASPGGFRAYFSINSGRAVTRRLLAITTSQPTSIARARSSKSLCGPKAITGMRRVAGEDLSAATHAAQGMRVLLNSTTRAMKPAPRPLSGSPVRLGSSPGLSGSSVSPRSTHWIR